MSREPVDAIQGYTVALSMGFKILNPAIVRIHKKREDSIVRSAVHPSRTSR